MKPVVGKAAKYRDHSVWYISRLAYEARGVGPRDHPSSNVQSPGEQACLGSVPLESPGEVAQNVDRNDSEMEASMDGPRGGRLGGEHGGITKEKQQKAGRSNVRPSVCLTDCLTVVRARRRRAEGTAPPCRSSTLLRVLHVF
jgi:hypothetical protein